MSARAESSSRSTARSPSETIPTGVPPSSTTGRRRTSSSRIRAIAASMSSSALRVVGFAVQMSPIRVEDGSLPSATARTTMSRSVRIPWTESPWVTITAPKSPSRIALPASTAVSSALQVAGSRVITSLTLSAISSPFSRLSPRVGYPRPEGAKRLAAGLGRPWARGPGGGDETRSSRLLGVELRLLAWGLLPPGPAAGALAGALRADVRHGRGQRDLLPAAGALDGRGLGGAFPARLPVRRQGEPLPHPHPPPAPPGAGRREVLRAARAAGEERQARSRSLAAPGELPARRGRPGGGARGAAGRPPRVRVPARELVPAKRRAPARGPWGGSRGRRRRPA